jgi:hypothetical protein
MCCGVDNSLHTVAVATGFAACAAGVRELYVIALDRISDELCCRCCVGDAFSSGLADIDIVPALLPVNDALAAASSVRRVCELSQRVTNCTLITRD